MNTPIEVRITEVQTAEVAWVIDGEIYRCAYMEAECERFLA